MPDEHARVDFNQHAREVHNLVRGCDPQPGAFAVYEGKQVRLYEATLEVGLSSGAVGEIVAIDSAGMRIALEGATLWSNGRASIQVQKRSLSAELAQSGGLRVGMFADT